ncbi:MAG: hypothetical protein NTZ42_02320 [Candidatus Gribaldobacteria bacterium]|nr:hypothetical protein [Candidatus Gribaldobacteria bacterium]
MKQKIKKSFNSLSISAEGTPIFADFYLKNKKGLRGDCPCLIWLLNVK